jgi:hypothetical protein
MRHLRLDERLQLRKFKGGTASPALFRLNKKKQHDRREGNGETIETREHAE